MEYKLCKSCGKEKLLVEFRFRSDTNKYRNDCKECQSKKYKKYYTDNKNKKLESVKEYRENNPDKIKKSNKESYFKHIEKRKKYSRIWYEENKEKELLYQIEYRKNNKEKLKNYHRKYYTEKLKNSLSHRIKSSISAQIRNSIKDKKNGRHWEDIVGYSLNELMKHLTSIFDKNMNWDNYGSYWQIDHIIPVTCFDLLEEKEIKRCWDLRNLRPLEKNENNSKNNKILFQLIKQYEIKDLLPNNF